MQPLYDHEAPKKATNLSLNRDLLAQFDVDVNPNKGTRAFFPMVSTFKVPPFRRSSLVSLVFN